LFMEHLVAHCRAIDQVISAGFGSAPYDDAHLWEVPFMGQKRSFVLGHPRAN
jgi:hypothetical protein